MFDGAFRALGCALLVIGVLLLLADVLIGRLCGGYLMTDTRPNPDAQKALEGR